MSARPKGVMQSPPSAATLHIMLGKVMQVLEPEEAVWVRTLLLSMSKAFWILSRELDDAHRTVDEICGGGMEAEIDTCADELSSADVDVMARAKRLLKPGCSFFGDIMVPGINEAEPDEDVGRCEDYKFMIVGEVRDPVNGGMILYARHEAYEDIQFCDVTLSLEPGMGDGETQVAISFADGETTCSGMIDVENKTIVGNVRQIQFGEEGFEYPSDEVTHTFKLVCKSDPNGNAIHAQSRLLEIEDMVASYLAKYKGRDFAFTSREELEKVDWIRIFEIASLYCERKYSELRFMAAKMKSVKFATQSQKRSVRQGMRADGYSKTSAHRVIDKGLAAMHAVLSCKGLPHAVANLEPGAYHGVYQTTYKEQLRASMVFQKFESAINAFNSRLTSEEIKAWRVNKNSRGEIRCAICLGGYEDDDDDDGNADDLLTLPCKHSFHESCISTWVHSFASCPTCRHDLSTSE